MPTSAWSDPDNLMRLLSLLALLLYLGPNVFRSGISPRLRLWLQRAAIALLTAGVAIALFESVRWFVRG